MNGKDLRRRVPPPGGWQAKVVAVLSGVLVLACLAAATATGPWWYVWRAWGLVCLALLTGAAVAWAARPAARLSDSRRPAAATVPADTRPLLEALVELVDQTPTPAHRYRMERALSDAGFTAFQADGEVFDPTRHKAVDVQATDDPALVHRVAQTLRPGYSQGRTVVHVAQVLVYQAASTVPSFRSPVR